MVKSNQKLDPVFGFINSFSHFMDSGFMLNETDENYLTSLLLMKEVSKSANKANLVHMYKSTVCLCLSLNSLYQ